MEIRSRGQWGARPPKRAIPRIALPSAELWLHHGASSNEYSDGARVLRAYQAWHMDRRGWSDIGYSFAVDKFGYIYECRGAGGQGAHTSSHNTRSHGICYIGDGTPGATAKGLDALILLVRYGIERGWWKGYLTGGHRDVAQTACPGNGLYRQIPNINSRVAGIASAPPPAPSAALWRVIVDGAQVGAYGERVNVLRAVDRYLDRPHEIKIVR